MSSSWLSAPPMYKESAMAETGGDGGGEHYSRLTRELCALLVTVIPASSTPAPGRGGRGGCGGGRTRSASSGASPAAVASMLLGASMALMLCGSVTFAIGFLLMPWVAGLAMLFGFAAAVSALSSGVFGKAGLLAYSYDDAKRGRICAPVSSASSPSSNKLRVVASN